MISDCCGAEMLGENDGEGFCGDCKEHCSGQTEDDDD